MDWHCYLVVSAKEEFVKGGKIVVVSLKVSGVRSCTTNQEASTGTSCIWELTWRLRCGAMLEKEGPDGQTYK